MEPYENMDEQLKIMNLISLKDIITDQKKNEDIQHGKDKLILKQDIYHKREKKRENNLNRKIQQKAYKKHT